MDSPHGVLGIDRDADEEAIERAYRRRVKETHPDQGGSAARFRRVQAAYEAITTTQPSTPTVNLGTGEDDVTAGQDRSPPAEPEWEDPAPPTYEVEYLNYDVMADYEWTLTDAELFSRAREEDLSRRDYGRVTVEPEESLLEAAERAGFAWPFACRGGACANCAVAVLSGDMGLPVDHVLPQEMTDRGIRLSCVGAPITEDTSVVYNVKHMPDLEELRLPPTPFKRAQAGD